MSQEGFQPASADTSLSSHESQRTHPRKTPIQILHEYGTKSGNLPVYVMEKAEGEAHQPHFVFSVRIGDVDCSGQGSSKKAAKHQAAVHALSILHIDYRKVSVPVNLESNGVVAETNQPNFVGILQELALQRGWRLPEYTDSMEAGPPHKKEFTVTCRMESLSEKAAGNSKKAAKKAAAEKMVSKLQSLSGCSEITWTPKPSVENLRSSTAETIGLLRRNPLSIPNTDYIQRMLGPSKEQGFEVTYFDIETPTSPATQESGRQGSLSAPNAPNQVPQSLGAEGAGSFEMPDSPSGFNGGGVWTVGLSGHLKIEVVKTMPPQKNMSCSEPPTSQPSDTNTEVLGTYPMTSAKRGICLIVNNFDFTKSKNHQNREGTTKDEECLHKVFAWLGFEVEVKRDCEGEEMLTALRELASRNHGQADCLVCCVLSHGHEGCVYGVDGHTVAIKKLKEPFNGLNCAPLAGKPKLFFIQACQGTGEQKAANVVPDGPEDSAVCSDAFKASDAIPSDADFLLGMSTVPSFVSYRHRKNGSWFIESLCQNLVQMVPKGCDLVSIMTKVNADVAKKTDEAGVKKQMPQPAFSLRRKVVFPIPKGLPPSLLH